MKTMKQIITLMLALLLVLSLCACSPTETSGSGGGDWGESLRGHLPRNDSKDPEPTELPADDPESPEPTDEPTPAAGVTQLALYAAEKRIWEYGDGYKLLYDVKWPQLRLGEDDADRYPALNAALADYGADMSEDMQSVAEEFSAAMQEYSAEQSAGFSMTNTCTLRPCRADSTAVSLLSIGTGYTGGAHGFRSYYALNLDTQTGAILQLEDVVTDADAVLQIITEKLEVYADEFYVEDVYAALSQQLEDGSLVWTLDGQGLRFYFSQYVLAPYAAGEFFAELYYDEAPELFRSEYRAHSEAYAVELGDERGFRCDLDGDFAAEKISWYPNTDEYGCGIGITVSVNDVVYHLDELYFYDADCTLMHLAGGETILLFDCVSDNDCHFLQPCLLEKGGVTLLEQYGMTGAAYEYDPETWTATRTLITDPDCFDMATRIQLLSTVSGCRSYRMTEHGLEPLSELYTVHSNLTFTALKDLTCDVIDETGAVLEAGAGIPAGTQLTYARTDRETLVDLLSEDGRLCRFTIRAEWPQTINGMEITECLDGLMFAG